MNETLPKDQRNAAPENAPENAAETAVETAAESAVPVAETEKPPVPRPEIKKLTGEELTDEDRGSGGRSREHGSG